MRLPGAAIARNIWPERADRGHLFARPRRSVVGAPQPISRRRVPPGKYDRRMRKVPTETPFQQAFADLAELRQRAKLACERSEMLRRDHRIIVDAARSQSRSLISEARRPRAP